MIGANAPTLTIALPSKGSLCDGALALFERSNLRIRRPSEKGYIGTLRGFPEVRVLMQRAGEIPKKLLDGSVHLGVTGRDIIAESFQGADVEELIPNLGFGEADLVLAAPISWLDVRDMHDLAALASDWRRRGRKLRIATKFERLTTDFLQARGIRHFEIVPSEGTTELDPNIGVADLIADLTSTGTALRENQLKVIGGGEIFSSTACLVTRIANVRTLEQARLLRHIVRTLEATLLAEEDGGLYQIAAYCFATARDTLSRELGKLPADKVNFYTFETVERDGTPLVKYEVICTRKYLNEVVKPLQYNGREVLVNRTDARFRKDARAILRLQRLLKDAGKAD